MQASSRFGTYSRRPVQKHHRNWLIPSAIAVILLILSLIMAQHLGRGGIRFELDDAALAVTAPDHSVTSVAYADIRSVALYTGPDYGTCAHGTQKPRCWSGTWRNAEWQTYRLCVDPKVQSCVMVRTDDGVFAFNAGSEAKTLKIKAALDEALAVHR
ncbi:MAG: hypothetical protein IJJ45_02105 [Clostridia bacterium]|nr:hypothetical protein [Clostridia bacterium]